MLTPELGFAEIVSRIKSNSTEIMNIKAERELNPKRYYLSTEAKKRLRWMYLLYYECSGNVTQASHKIGVSRTWLSILKNKFERSNKDPRSLEPDSRTPHNMDNRKRISEQTELAILEVRKNYGWGKDKIAPVVKRGYGLDVSKTTAGRYLRKHHKIDLALSLKHKKYWQGKLQREGKEKNSLIKYRPPSQIKDFCPGALIEKDVKLVPKFKQNHNLPYLIKENFYYQHTFLDSFTRLRFTLN